MSTHILSVQSHVTHGYVGNKAAVFPLQLHGFDVDAINTVSLSNHSGYPVIKGHRMDLEEFLTIVEGLRANTFLCEYSYVLSGYINNAEVIKNMKQLVCEINGLRQAAKKPKTVYVCDPVMGDDGRLYCKDEVIQAYRDLLSEADVVTPNYFEATVLSGIEVTDVHSAVNAADWFHDHGAQIVIIKSFAVPDDSTKLQFLISKMEGGAARQRWTGFVPFYEGRYTGTGDVFAASFLAFIHKHGLPEAVALAMGVLQDLILETRREGGSGEASLNARELRVTHAVESLLRPTTAVAVSKLS